MLPTLLPAYQQADIRERPYGKTVFQGETKYYEVFKYAKGEFLRDMLVKNPQPWYQHAAWMIISLADVIAFLHLKAQKLHLNLNPDIVFVRIDKQGIPRPLLLDLGMLGEPNAVDYSWVQRHAQPAYTAPELISPNGGVGYTADVYGLGLLFYEMLAGHPAFASKLHRDDEVRQAVVASAPDPVGRTDLSQEIHQIVHQAIHRTPAFRQQDVRVFAKMIRSKFGEVPAEKKRTPSERRIVGLIVLAAFLLVVAIMLSAVFMG
jgi:eukaryotic-like serine/threonine-protein kinase